MADGITAVVYNVTKELAKRGHEVAVFTSDMLDLHGNKSLRSGHSVVNGVNVYYSKSVWRSKTFIATPGVFSLLSKKLSNYDVIHIHDCRSFQGVVAYLFAKAKHVPYVFQPHGSYLPLLAGSQFTTAVKIALDKLVGSGIIRNASKIIGLSQVEAAQYRSIGIPDENIAFLPNGLDLLEYCDLPSRGSFRKKFNISENTKIILYLGRIHKTKGIDLLINAYAYLVKTLKCTDVMLIVAGPDDGCLSELKSLAHSLGVSDSVLFTGFVNGEDKLCGLVDADAFVTPSFFGFPMTFLEACITGTPIVTTTLGDRLDWIDGKVGYVTSPKKIDLANALHRLISDDTLRAEFSGNGQKLVRAEFSLEAVVDKLEKVYAEVT